MARNRQYTVRLMAPFNMRCKTCGEYIYKGKKFNARKEDVEGDDYLGIRIYRFYIKCTRCLQEISFKTDPKNTDYEIEAGATRNFMALKLAEEQAQREEDEEKEEEATNPMKLLEKRTQQSKQELELLESLEELKDLNRRQQTIDYDQMLERFDNKAARQKTLKEQEEIDEQYVKSIFRKKPPEGTVVEEEIVELSADDDTEPPRKVSKASSSSDLESTETGKIDSKESTTVACFSARGSSWSGNSGLASSRTNIGSLVKKKTILGVKTNTNSVGEKCTAETSTKPTPVAEDIVDNDASSKNTESTRINANEKPQAMGLSLLGAYSGSSDNDSD